MHIHIEHLSTFACCKIKIKDYYPFLKVIEKVKPLCLFHLSLLSQNPYTIAYPHQSRKITHIIWSGLGKSPIVQSGF